jgi:crotonobetainyl-CoA:carnitine CoA-transferase CaiB-like acyl-CoA transferase
VLDRIAARADVIVLDSDSGFDLPESDDGHARVIVAIQGFRSLDDADDPRIEDVSLWATSGLLDLARGTANEPVLPPGFQAAYNVGLHAAVTAMAAVVNAGITGESARVEVEASEVLSTLLLASGALDHDPEAADHDEAAIRDGRPSWLVETADGEVLVNANGVYADDLLAFARGWGLIGGECDQPAEDFGRSAALELRAWSRAQLVERAQEWRLPAGAVLSLDELEQDEQIRHRGTLVSVDDPQLGTVVMPWLPWTETALDD